MTQDCKFKLGKWRLNTEKNVLVKGSQQLALKPLLTKLLAHFLENAGEVQSIDVLKKNVWQQEFLTDSAVKKAISELRKILVLTGLNDGELIKTEPHRGYRYIGPAEQTSIRVLSKSTVYWASFFTLIICIIAIMFIPAQRTSITLVEKTENTVSGSSEQAYTQLVRTTLISALSPYYSVRQLYSRPNSRELILSYWVEDNHRLSVSLHDEQNKLLWEKRLILDNQIHHSLLIFIDELSQLLNKPLAAPTLTTFNQPEAFELFVKGKISYYQQGLESNKAELLFKRSLQLQPSNNPSNAALLDIYGLQSRSKQKSDRSKSLQLTLEKQRELVASQTKNIPENAVALAKYYLVNLGDSEGALAVIKDNLNQLTQSYDLHILAFAYALNGDEKNSNFFIELAEQRFPQRNAVLWYKVMINLIHGDLNNAQLQSQWAQDIAPDWYPLNFIAPRLFAGNEQEVLEYMARYPRPLFDSTFSNSTDLGSYVDDYFTFLEQESLEQINLVQGSLNTIKWQPFETEIAYLLAKFYFKKDAEHYIVRYVTAHYPEKLMMLKMIDTWFILYR